MVKRVKQSGILKSRLTTYFETISFGKAVDKLAECLLLNPNWRSCRCEKNLQNTVQYAEFKQRRNRQGDSPIEL